MMYPATNEIPKLISRPFLLLRLVVFVILLLLNVLTLSFSAFNITASRTWDHYVSAGPSLAVFNSSVFLFLSLLLLGERKYSHAIPPISMVSAEVCWMTLMTILTFLSSVLSTRVGPARMCSTVPVNMAMCSSSILVLPVSWMNFLVFFAYSVTLFIVTVLHASFVPDIWYSTVSEIPWFDFSDSSFLVEKSDLEHRAVYGDAFRPALPPLQTLKPPPRAPWLNLTRTSVVSVASFTPAWAKQHNAGLTRGLHNPFSRSRDEGSATHHALPPVPLRHPARAITKPTFDGSKHDDSFAASTKYDTVTTKVPDYYDDNKKHTLEPLVGLDGLLRWSTTTAPDRTSNTTITTTTVVFPQSARRSVSSLFPHDVGEDAWNLPLKKPPFRNGRGEGWTTAAATQATLLSPRGRGGGKCK